MASNPYGNPYGHPGGGNGYPPILPQQQGYQVNNTPYTTMMQPLHQPQPPAYTTYGGQPLYSPPGMQPMQPQPPPMSYHPGQNQQPQPQQAQQNNFHNVSALVSAPPNLQQRPVIIQMHNQQQQMAPHQMHLPQNSQQRPPMPPQQLQRKPAVQTPNLPPGITIQRPKLPPGIQVQRTSSPPSMRPLKPKSSPVIPNLPSSIQIQREPAKTIPKLPAGISISHQGSSNSAVENKLPKSLSVSRTPAYAGSENASGISRLNKLAGISIVGGGGSSGAPSAANKPNNGAPQSNTNSPLSRLSHLNVSIRTGNESAPPPPKAAQSTPKPPPTQQAQPMATPARNSEAPNSQHTTSVTSEGPKSYRPLVKDFRSSEENDEGFDLSKVKTEPGFNKGSKPDTDTLPPATYFQRRAKISLTPANRERSSSESSQEEDSTTKAEAPKNTPSDPKEDAVASNPLVANADERNSAVTNSVESNPVVPSEVMGSEDESKKDTENDSKKDTENEQGKMEIAESGVSEEEKGTQVAKNDSMEDEEAEKSDDKTRDNQHGDTEETNNQEKGQELSAEERGDEEQLEKGDEEQLEKEDEEQLEKEDGDNLNDTNENDKTEVTDENPEVMEEHTDTEPEQGITAPESLVAEDEPMTEDNSDSQSGSQFKKPPESVSNASLDGSATDEAKKPRGGRLSVASVESTTSASESSEIRRQSVNEGLAAQYAQQLAFYRNPIVGQDTVCMFCLTRCASKSPKILTCLHSACEDCFKERLEAAAKDEKLVDSVTVDEDGCPIAAEVVVSCPLCKVTTSEKELVDNYFLTASEDVGEDDIPQNNICTNCEDQNLATSYCEDCAENLCEDCVKAHKRLKIFKDHKLVVIDVSASSGRSISAAAGAPKDLNCHLHSGEKLVLYCETCEVLTCKDCQLSERHRSHKHSQTHEVVPEVKNSLAQTASDLRLKRNVLDENRSLLGTKLSEVNIKEKSLMTQLQDLKAYMITKLDARFRELSNEVSKIVREKRKQIDGRKTVLDRYYVQADYALAFVDYSMQFSENDDKALLVAKRTMERQMRRLKKVDPSTGLQSDAGLKLDLYFQQFASQKMHSCLESVLRQVLNDIKVLSGPPPVPMQMAPQMPHMIPQSSQLRQIMASQRPPPQIISSPAKKSAVTPTKQATPIKIRGSPVRVGMVTSRGRGATSTISSRGRGSTTMMSRGRGAPVGRGMTSSRGAPVPRGAINSARASMANSRGRGGISQTSMRGQRASNNSLIQRGAMTSRPGLNITRQDPSLNQTAAVAAALTSKGAISITVDPKPKPPPLQMRPGQQAQPQHMGHRQHMATGGPRPQMNQPRPVMRQPHPGVGGMRPSGQYNNVDPYYMAAYVKQQPPQGYPHQFSHNQMPPGAQRPPQISPGSSWHTPQGLSMQPISSNQMSVSDNSFKITIPSKSIGGRSNSPDIVTLDKDGAPIFSPPAPSTLSIPVSMPISTQGSFSNITSISSSSLPKGISITPTVMVPQAQAEKQSQSNIDGVPDLTSLLDVDDWDGQIGSSSHTNQGNQESDPLNIDPPSSTANTIKSDVPMVQIEKPASLETELDLGTITDPNAVKTELNLANLEKFVNETNSKLSETLTNNVSGKEDPVENMPSPEMEGNDEEENSQGKKSEGDEDWCAVCHDGGDTLYCCDRCPKVYHLFCYIPPLTEEPPDDWVCDMCRTQDEIFGFSTNKKIPKGQMSESDQKMCTRILFELYNQYPESVMFRDCSDLNFKEYLDIIKEPVALDVIKEKLDRDNPEMYCTVPEFLADVRKMFRNCLKFHDKDSEFYSHGKTLEEFLDKFLEQWLPDYACETFENYQSSLPELDSEPSTSTGKKRRHADSSSDESRKKHKMKKIKKEKKAKKKSSKGLSTRALRKDGDFIDDLDSEEETAESDDSELSNTKQLDHLDELESMLNRKKKKKKVHSNDDEEEPSTTKSRKKKKKSKK